MFTQTRAHFTDLAESMHGSIERTVPTPQIVIYRHDQGLPAEPSEGGVSWHPIKTQCSIVLIQLSPEAQQSKTTRGNLVQRPTDPCWDFVSYCYGMGQRHPGEPADNISSRLKDWTISKSEIRHQIVQHTSFALYGLSHTPSAMKRQKRLKLSSLIIFTHLSFSRP